MNEITAATWPTGLLALLLARDLSSSILDWTIQRNVSCWPIAAVSPDLVGLAAIGGATDQCGFRR
jgi:hypothetical protein